MSLEAKITSSDEHQKPTTDRRDCPCIGSSGQSLVEMVVLLPVILMLLFGIEFLRELVDARIRAVEAARYLTWESLWYVEQGRPGGRGDAVLRQELTRYGLGPGLVNVNGVAERAALERFSLRAPRDGARPEPFAPKLLKALFSGGDSPADARRQFALAAGSLAERIPPPLREPAGTSHFFGRVIAALDLAAGGGDPPGALYALPDLIAQSTGFEAEAARSVVTARATYRFRAMGILRGFPAVRIVEQSSILTQPYAVPRSDDAGELEALVGDPADGCDARGRLYGLWLIPEGGGAGPAYDVSPTLVTTSQVKTAARSAKCGAATMDRALAYFAPLGPELHVKMPFVVLEETPERHAAEDEGRAADFEDGFGSGVGGVGGGPLRDFVGF